MAVADSYRRHCRPSSSSTRRAASAERHFGNEPAGPFLSAPQIPPLLRGESHLHRAIYGCVSSALLPLPSAPGPSTGASMPRRRTLLLELDLSSRPRSSRDYRPSTDTARYGHSMKCRGEGLINALPRMMGHAIPGELKFDAVY